MRRDNLWAALWMVLVCSACTASTEMLGSHFVKEQLISANAGGTLTVTAADSATLAGLQISVPPGALTADATLTVAYGSVTPAGSKSAGPAVDLGPDGAHFNLPVSVTLPYALPSGAQSSQLVVDAVESNGKTYQIANSAVTLSGAFVSFTVTGFTQFQPDVVDYIPPPPDAGCTDGLTACPDGDGGTLCADTTSDPANCGSCGYVCPQSLCAGSSCILDAGALLDGGSPSSGCSGSLTACPDGDGGTLCADTTSDPANCGSCGHVCPQSLCADSFCVLDAGVASDGGSSPPGCSTQGMSCNFDDDCCSDRCTHDYGWGICLGDFTLDDAGVPICAIVGAGCWGDSDCCSSVCSNYPIGTFGPGSCLDPAASVCNENASSCWQDSDCCGGICLIQDGGVYPDGGVWPDGGDTGDGVCSAPGGLVDPASCYNDLDCISEYCQNWDAAGGGVCTNPSLAGCTPNGDACALDTDCCSGYCPADAGCRESPSACLIIGSNCYQGLDCCSGNCVSLDGGLLCQ